MYCRNFDAPEEILIIAVIKLMAYLLAFRQPHISTNADHGPNHGELSYLKWTA